MTLPPAGGDRFLLARLPAGLAALLAVWLGIAVAQPGGAAGTIVQMKAREFVYEPKEVTVQPGEVVFVIKNEGAIEHNFVLEDGAGKKLAEIAIIEPSATEEVRVVITPGTYNVACTLPGHRQAGMVATLKVAE